MKPEMNPRVAARQLRNLSRLRPKLAVILGSGFQEAVAGLKVDAAIDYRKLAGFPVSGVSGHAGRAAIGRLAGTPVMALIGRAHYYEGFAMDEVTFGVRVLAECGIRDVLFTNAAGGINPRFHPADFMVLTDHINLMGVNPLRGAVPAGQSRFVDMTRTYDKELSGLLRQAGRRCGLRLRTGVYVATSGPSYETPAEIKAFARMGGDAVGMSTVPEVMVARQCGLNVAALSCITNPAAGRGKGALTHAEVLATVAKVEKSAARLLEEFARLYGESS